MPTFLTLLSRLTELRTRFDAGALKEKTQLLRGFPSLQKESGKALLLLHELLLFYEAYPHDEDFLSSVKRLLKALERELKRRLKNTTDRRAQSFLGTGITSTRVQAAFSLTLCDCLYRSFPKNIRLDSLGAEPEEAFTILTALLPSPLREFLNEGGHETLEQWLDVIAGSNQGDNLGTLLGLFRDAGISLSVKDHLFERLGVYIDIDLEKVPSRTQLRLNIGERFFHRESLIRSIDCRKEIRKPISPSLELNTSQKHELIRTMRLQLIALYRETDPATYADERDIQVHDVGRGLCITLCGMTPDRRQPVDAYIGFMAFKNGRPYAYGGAWMLGRSAKIGINVFPTYRGGESAWFFAQLMRVYYQVFKPDCFIAEPYQIGRGNPEGLETGAFWFYYRLGFRPVKRAQRQLATQHFAASSLPGNKKNKQKVLEKLVEDEMVLTIEAESKRSVKYYDTLRLSRSLTRYINKHHRGDLSGFLRAAREHLQKELIPFNIKPDWNESDWPIEQLSPYLFASGGISRWSKQEKKDLLMILKEKTMGRDSQYAILAGIHPKFNEALARLAHSSPL